MTEKQGDTLFVFPAREQKDAAVLARLQKHLAEGDGGDLVYYTLDTSAQARILNELAAWAAGRSDIAVQAILKSLFSSSTIDVRVLATGKTNRIILYGGLWGARGVGTHVCHLLIDDCDVNVRKGAALAPLLTHSNFSIYWSQPLVSPWMQELLSLGAVQRVDMTHGQDEEAPPLFTTS